MQRHFPCTSARIAELLNRNRSVKIIFKRTGKRIWKLVQSKDKQYLHPGGVRRVSVEN